MEKTNGILNDSKMRNNKMTELIVTLITFSQKIQELKQKICGFSPSQFSPQQFYYALDEGEKGYLDATDISIFLNNDSFSMQTFAALFSKLNASQQTNKLTYLGYLNLLKPYFSKQLARDMLARDKLHANKQQISKQGCQRVFLLINELLLMYCVCISQLEATKLQLATQYLLNIHQIYSILNLERKNFNPLSIFLDFIKVSSNYIVQAKQMKYLLAYLNISQSHLCHENNISSIFMPNRYRNTTNSITINSINNTMSNIPLHSSYEKTFLTRKDLMTKDGNFLTYKHPKSIARDIPQRDNSSMTVKEVTNKKENQRNFLTKQYDVKQREQAILEQTHYQPVTDICIESRIKQEFNSTVETPFLDNFLKKTDNCAVQGKLLTSQVSSERESRSAFVPMSHSRHKRIFQNKNIMRERLEQSNYDGRKESVLDQFMKR